jgi:alginate O-acetyltransferase complex protein AlgJ
VEQEAPVDALVAEEAPPVEAAAEPVADPAPSASVGVDRAFRELCAAKAETVPEGKMTVSGSDGWLFLKSELTHVSAGTFWGEGAAKVSKSRKPENADPMPAILDFKRQLDELGIELILLPVPPKAALYPDKLSADIAANAKGDLPRVDTAHQELYKLLADAGVQVIDLYPVFAKMRAAGNEPFCKQDTHYSGSACVEIAKLIAASLKAKDRCRAIATTAFVGTVRPTEIAGDLWKDLADETVPRETLALRFVSGPDGEVVPADKASPVLLLGDSHTLVFNAGNDMHTRGAGLADQLSLELGFAIDLLGVRGSGATPARAGLYRRGGGQSEYIKGKKAVIWCFTAREFTESSRWSIVPVCKETAAKK